MCRLLKKKFHLDVERIQMLSFFVSFYDKRNFGEKKFDFLITYNKSLSLLIIVFMLKINICYLLKNWKKAVK